MDYLTRRLDDRDRFAAEMEAADDAMEAALAQERYDKLVGLTYLDAQGRIITVLDVDEWGRALLERDGEMWGCEAEYLEDIYRAR